MNKKLIMVRALCICDLRKRARFIAVHAHKGQVRKFTGEPYVTHPIRIGERIDMIVRDEATTCAAYLHDVLEDTAFTHKELVRLFGAEIADVVLGCSKISKKRDGTRAERKAIDNAHYARGCWRVHTIKLADMLDNVPSIIEHDPDFAKIYVFEKVALFGLLNKGEQYFRELANHMLGSYMNYHTANIGSNNVEK